MFGLGPMELTVIVVIIMIVFGAGKLPSVLTNIAKGLKDFKKEVKGLHDED